MLLTLQSLISQQLGPIRTALRGDEKIQLLAKKKSILVAIGLFLHGERKCAYVEGSSTCIMYA
jgi:hypothetical protein